MTSENLFLTLFVMLFSNKSFKLSTPLWLPNLRALGASKNFDAHRVFLNGNSTPYLRCFDKLGHNGRIPKSGWSKRVEQNSYPYDMGELPWAHKEKLRYYN